MGECADFCCLLCTCRDVRIPVHPPARPSAGECEVPTTLVGFLLLLLLLCCCCSSGFKRLAAPLPRGEFPTDTVKRYPGPSQSLRVCLRSEMNKSRSKIESCQRN